ncbi:MULTISPECIES: signal protein PDZ [unclassified Pseudoalteromonas]|uniref:signal protein PDZ n=1 Tax=unclassified Pseudoalteromonas TaxID=194690 RepID=UPI000C077F17|nr:MULTISPECIES: signal protein PDZ [unclassified Pseudoalteromonas]MDP2635355.1 signal protein PDZ [Pseudoalteromonas sp. 1_MG-2023]PHN89789.1 signal protein PDZ [Pseudoalteromonas sp. 3D05]
MSKYSLILFLFVLLKPFNLFAATQWIDFKVVNGKVVVPAEIEGIAVNAILDTGQKEHYISEQFLISHPLADRKGKSIDVKDTSTEARKFLYNQVKLDIFGFNNKLDEMRPTKIDDGDIILGIGFFHNFVMQFDYPKRKLRFLDRKSIDLRAAENIDMRLHRQSALPIVKVNLNDSKSIWALISTGAQEGLKVERTIIENQGWDKSLASTPVEIVEINGPQTYELSNIPKVEFGPFNVDAVSIAYPQEGKRFELLNSDSFTGSNLKGMDVKGVLGYDLLQHFLITVDFKYGHMHVGLSE